VTAHVHWPARSAAHRRVARGGCLRHRTDDLGIGRADKCKEHDDSAIRRRSYHHGEGDLAISIQPVQDLLDHSQEQVLIGAGGHAPLDLRTEADVRAACRRLEERFAGKLRNVMVQPMIGGGTELLIGVAHGRLSGPLVVFGLGGVAMEVLADHAAQLTPLTDVGADTLIRSIRSAPLLLGHRGSPAADLRAPRDLLLRVSRLADDLPEVTDLDLNPVIARPDGAFVVDARVKAAPYAPQDPFLSKPR
jgi:hypothetical protein